MAKRPSKIQQEIDSLRKSGVVLPRNPQRAAETAREMKAMVTEPNALARDMKSFERWSSHGGTESPEVASINANTRALQAAMGNSRRVSSMRRTAAGNDIAVAIPRFYDPLEYWDLSGLPWNMADEGHRHKLHKWLRLYYATHRLVPTLIDIFTRFPLQGLEFSSPDRKVTEFYEELFLNDLDYENFLVSLGREHFTVGEAFALGSFNEALGVWDREELLNPEDIVVENMPLLGTKQLKVVPPEYLRRLASTKSPPDQFKLLSDNYPELLPYLRRGEPFPVSEVLLKQVAFKITDWDDHGTPILLRGLRTLLHEEKLLASQDAIAERLYSPLILAKLGVNNVGDNEGPWIPTPDQLESFRDDMDVALSSDFRLMVYHYALEVENVFGREQVPNLGDDFDRIDRWLMQIFGLQNVLGSGSNSSPYATSALNAEFLNQMLSTYQWTLKKHIQDRMAVVAEAQGHYDYEKRGQTRVPIMEEVVEYDDEGNPYIVEKNKLMIPDVNFATLDMRDEATERQFLQTLRDMAVPISDQRLMVGVSFDFKDSLDEMQEEMVQKTVAKQMAKLQTYKILRARGLSIPPDLKAEIEGNAAAPPGGMGGPPGMGGGMGGPPPGGPPGMGGPGMGDLGGEGGPGPGGENRTVVAPPPPPDLGTPPPYSAGSPGGGPGAAPDISSERRTHVLAGPNWEAQVDEELAALQQELSDIEFRKRMRTSSFERGSNRKFATEDINSLPLSNEKIVVDKVPPAFRREYFASYAEDNQADEPEIS